MIRRSVLLLSLVAACLGAQADTFTLLSKGPDGSSAAGHSGSGSSPWVSSDGAWVAFESIAPDLTQHATNGLRNIYLYNTQTTSITLVSRASEAGNGNSDDPKISRDGRYVVFESEATNLVPNDTNGKVDIFRYDRVFQRMELVSITGGGRQGNGNCYDKTITTNGREVTFSSSSSNWGFSGRQIYTKDMQTGALWHNSRSSGDAQASIANNECIDATISPDGSMVAFQSYATNLVPNDTNGLPEIIVRNRVDDVTFRATTGYDGSQANGRSDLPRFSGDGKYLSFRSNASNLILNGPSTTNIYRRRMTDGFIELVSVKSNGSPVSHAYWHAISGDGSMVAYSSSDPGIVPGFSDGRIHVYLVNMVRGTTVIVSATSAGIAGNADSTFPALTFDGKTCMFSSLASNLVSRDLNNKWDVFSTHLPMAPQLAVKVSPRQVPSGSSAAGGVILRSPAPASGAYVRLSASRGISVPAQVLIPPRQTSASFEVSISPEAPGGTAFVSASLAQWSARVELNVLNLAPLPLPSEDIKLMDWSRVREVKGIVCDNNIQTPASDQNRLNVTLPSKYISSTMYATVKPNSSRNLPSESLGRFVNEDGVPTYYPPIEFNTDQTGRQLDLEPLRSVVLEVTVMGGDGKQYRGRRTILLARPPMLLVHGINSSATAWTPGRQRDSESFTRRYSARAKTPFITIDHSKWMFGRGFVETAAQHLSSMTALTIKLINEGKPLFYDFAVHNKAEDSDPFRFDQAGGYENRQYVHYAKAAGPLSCRRVDLIGHSYGGLICRWAMHGKASDPFSGSDTFSWYYNPRDSHDYVPFTRPIGNSVRKFITLGSMWRGVPLCNFINSFLAPLPGEYDLGQATTGLPWTSVSEIVRHPLLPLQDERFPTWQVMAVDSKWLRHLNGLDSEDGLPKLTDAIGYGSVAGVDSQVDIPLGSFGFVNADNQGMYSLLDCGIFPYFPLESVPGAVDRPDNNDNTVPLWSAALPGTFGRSYIHVDANHSELVTHPDTIQYVTRMANSQSLPTGSTLRALWYNERSQVASFPNGRRWQFGRRSMAPQPWDRVYQLVKEDPAFPNGVARIARGGIWLRSEGLRIEQGNVLFSWPLLVGATAVELTMEDSGGEFYRESFRNMRPGKIEARIRFRGLPGLRATLKWRWSAGPGEPEVSE